MKLQMKTLQIILNVLFGRPQKIFLVVQHNKIVHVAQVILAPQFFFDEMIQTIQINVGKEL